MSSPVLPFSVIKGGRRRPRVERRSELERLAAQVVRACPQHVEYLCGLLGEFLKPEAE